MTQPSSPTTPGLPATDEAAVTDGRDAGAPATAVAPRRRRRWAAPLAILIGLLVLLLAGGFWFLRSQIHDTVHGISRQQLLPSGATAPALDGPVTFLIAGSDSRDPATDPGNSDTLMIGYVPADRQHVYLISVPRDLWVKIHGEGYAKVNAAYDEGGAPLTISTLDDLFGGNVVQHAAVMNFEGFMKMVDNLGGIDIDNPYATESVGDVFPAGRIHLDGDQALNYVRERHELTNGDLDRTGRQRAVIKAIVQKALSAGALSNPAKEKQFLQEFAGCVTLDSSLSDDAITNFLLSMKIKSSDDIRSIMLPIGGYATAYDGEDIDVMDPQQVSDLAAALRNNTMDQWWATHSSAPLITGHLGEDTWSTPDGNASSAEPTGATPTSVRTGYGYPTSPAAPTRSGYARPSGGVTTGYGTQPTTGPTTRASR